MPKTNNKDKDMVENTIVMIQIFYVLIPSYSLAFDLTAMFGSTFFY